MSTNKISLFGGHGYIGSEFYRQCEKESVLQDKFDYVPKTSNAINFISTVHNYNVYDKPYLDIDTNLTTLLTILENGRKRYGKNFEITHISSWFVYGSQASFPVKETAPCKPKGFYSITKLASEQLLASYCETYDLKYRILRLPNVIGKDDAGAGRKKNALQYMIDTLCADGTVQLYDAPIYRDYMDVRDVARAIKLSLSSASGEIINLGSGNTHKVWDLVHFAKSIAGRGKIEYIEVPDFHKKVQTDKMWLDNTKITNLGFRPFFIVQDTITDMIRERLNG